MTEVSIQVHYYISLMIISIDNVVNHLIAQFLMTREYYRVHRVGLGFHPKIG